MRRVTIQATKTAKEPKQAPVKKLITGKITLSRLIKEG